MNLTSMKQIQNPYAYPDIPDFPHAPLEWDKQYAHQTARHIGIEIGDSHWDAIRALHEIYYTSGHIKSRSLRKTLDRKLRALGGLKYLYQIFPGGPVSQGCYIAGLKPPHGVIDLAEGSVQ